MLEYTADIVVSLEVTIMLINELHEFKIINSAQKSNSKMLNTECTQVLLTYMIFLGLGAINMNNVSLLMSSSPSFSLIGDTSGGPPANSTWTRNGEVISDGNSYSISLAVNEVNTTRLGNADHFDGVILEESRYRSTLTVTSNLPGVYVYTVINRAMSAPRTASFTIEGIIEEPDLKEGKL